MYISKKLSVDADGAFWRSHFENLCSMVLIKYCLISLKDLCMKNNHILLFQSGKLKAYVYVIPSFLPQSILDVTGILSAVPQFLCGPFIQLLETDLLSLFFFFQVLC